jgi:copper chaperone
MNSIQVCNIKCHGCGNSIVSALEKAGMKDISVDIAEQKVFFDGDIETAKKLLSKMGYPEIGSPEAESLSKKAKSYVSCAIGRMK